MRLLAIRRLRLETPASLRNANKAGGCSCDPTSAVKWKGQLIPVNYSEPARMEKNRVVLNVNAVARAQVRIEGTCGRFQSKTKHQFVVKPISVLRFGDNDLSASAIFAT